MADAFDVAIVGGGPAGLSAALWLARYLRRVIVVDAGDPRNWETRGINGYLGLPKITPPELRSLGREECKRYGVTFIDSTVSAVDRLDPETYKVSLESGMSFTASRLLLAIGIVDVWPDIPGLERCYGKTAHVCPDCDGYEARDKKTVVIGAGKKAAGIALALTTWTQDIVICTHGEPANMSEELLQKLQMLNIPILESKISYANSVRGELICLDLEEGMSLDCEHLFFALGQEASDDLGAKLGCARDSIGRIIIDDRNHTSVHNVFAAGDIIPGPQLAIAAAASGAIAALAIHRSLLPAERTL
jgi:thioredoxin reductase